MKRDKMMTRRTMEKHLRKLLDDFCCPLSSLPSGRYGVGYFKATVKTNPDMLRVDEPVWYETAQSHNGTPCVFVRHYLLSTMSKKKRETYRKAVEAWNA